MLNCPWYLLKKYEILNSKKVPKSSLPEIPAVTNMFLSVKRNKEMILAYDFNLNFSLECISKKRIQYFLISI